MELKRAVVRKDTGQIVAAFVGASAAKKWIKPPPGFTTLLEVRPFPSRVCTTCEHGRFLHLDERNKPGRCLVGVAISPSAEWGDFGCNQWAGKE